MGVEFKLARSRCQSPLWTCRTFLSIVDTLGLIWHRHSFAAVFWHAYRSVHQPWAQNATSACCESWLSPKSPSRGFSPINVLLSCGRGGKNRIFPKISVTTFVVFAGAVINPERSSLSEAAELLFFLFSFFNFLQFCKTHLKIQVPRQGGRASGRRTGGGEIKGP